MKIQSILLSSSSAIVTLERTLATVANPGQCTGASDCLAAFGTGYDCVAIEANVAGLERLNMCIPSSEVCSGRFAGICPTFNSWPANYRVVQPVCAFTSLSTCTNVYNSTDYAGRGDVVGSPSNSSQMEVGGGVDCYMHQIGGSTSNNTVTGIYKCMDGSKYLSTNGGHSTDLTNAQIVACGGRTDGSAITLCNSHGTCSPVNDFSDQYACRCNLGYSTSNFCASISSNVCDQTSQCGSMGTCNIPSGHFNGTCSCSAGATGNKCSLCDASSASACNGHGTCSSSGVCTCMEGHSGTFCEVSKLPPATPSPSATPSPTTKATTASKSGVAKISLLVPFATLLISIFGLFA